MPPRMATRNVTFQLDHDNAVGEGAAYPPSQPRHHHLHQERVVPSRPSLKPSSLGPSPPPPPPPTGRSTTRSTRTRSRTPSPIAIPQPPSPSVPSHPRGTTTNNSIGGGGGGIGDSFDNSITSPSSIASDPNEAWRKHGKVFRAELVVTDEEKGGNTFALSNSCSIERYYKVAERVLDQFLATSISESSELTESYLVGNRLVKFLSVVLPTHVDYFSDEPRLLDFRNRSQAQLVELLQYMEELAMLIDEIEYNKYILQDLTPEEKNLVSGITIHNNTSVNESNMSFGNDTTLTSIDESKDDFDKENAATTTSGIVIASIQQQLASKEVYSPGIIIHDNTHTRTKTTSSTSSNHSQDSLHRNKQQQQQQTQQPPKPHNRHHRERKSWPQESSAWTQEVQSSSSPARSQRSQGQESEQHDNEHHHKTQQEQQQMHQRQQQQSTSFDEDFAEFAEFAKDRSTHSRIDLLLDADDDEPPAPAAIPVADVSPAPNTTTSVGPRGGGPNTTTSVGSGGGGASSGSSSNTPPRAAAPTPSPASTSGSSKPIPKVKPPPPSRPRFARRARSAGAKLNGNSPLSPSPFLMTSSHASLLEDTMRIAPPPPTLDEHQLTGPTMSSSVGGGSSSAATTTTVATQNLRCKIEERWDEAAQFRRRMQEEQDERMSHFNEWTPSQGRKLIDVDPSSGRDDDSDDAELSKASNRRILQQFKGCVKCLLD